MVHLLKEKSKVQWSAKPKKKYEPLKPRLKQQQEEHFDFSQEMRELNEKGPEAYLKKSGNQEASEMQIDSTN